MIDIQRQHSRLEAHADKVQITINRTALPAKVNSTRGPTRSDPWPMATTKTANNWPQTHAGPYPARP